MFIYGYHRLSFWFNSLFDRFQVEDLLKCLMLNKQCDIFLRSVSQEFSESLSVLFFL